MNSLSPERIVPWAAARSIFGASDAMNGFSRKLPELVPELLPSRRIAIGRKGLVFKDSSLLRAIETGFSLPEFFPFIKHPFAAFNAIVVLKKISRCYGRHSLRETDLVVLLRAGLEAMAVFANHHPVARELFSGFPEELVVFGVKGSSPLGWLRRSSEGEFSASSSDLGKKPTVSLSFSNIEVGFDAVKHGIDPLGAPATGDVQIRGKVHFMDKIGYVSRMTFKEVPMPKQ